MTNEQFDALIALIESKIALDTSGGGDYFLLQNDYECAEDRARELFVKDDGK